MRRGHLLQYGERRLIGGREFEHEAGVDASIDEHGDAAESALRYERVAQGCARPRDADRFGEAAL